MSPDNTHAFCHKCGKSGSILGGNLHSPITELVVQGTEALSSMFGCGMEETRAAPQLELKYTQMPDETITNNWDVYEVSECIGNVQEGIHAYCTKHNIIPLNLVQVHARILIPHTGMGLVSKIANPRMGMLFPIFRGGRVVQAIVRILNHERNETPWLRLGPDNNGQLLYTGALPKLAFDATKFYKTKTSCNTPLFIVESPVDALRMARHGAHAVALGGTNLNAKMKKELLQFPHASFVIMLDSDAIDKGASIQTKLINCCLASKRIIVHSIARINDMITDPCNLSSTDLRTEIIKVVQTLRKGGTKTSDEEVSRTSDDIDK